MTDSSGSGRDEWGRDDYVSGEQYSGEQYYGAGGSGSARPGPGAPSGYGASGQGGSGYGASGQGGSGYGASGQGGSGYGAPGPGAARPGPPGPAAPGQGGAGTPTNPLWQAAPGQAAPGQAAPGQGGPGRGAPPPAGSPPPAGQPMNPAMLGAPRAADSKGFLAALFDFSFMSFVTTRIIKVVYVLIFVLTLISAFIFTIGAFNASPLFGLLTLIIGDPLFILVVMAFWRLVLESFVVMFRIAEDIHAIRERGSGLR